MYIYTNQSPGLPWNVMYSTVVQSETTVSQGVELLMLPLQVGGGALAMCNPKSVIGQMLPPHSLPPGFGIAETSMCDLWWGAGPLNLCDQNSRASCCHCQITSS